MKQTKIYLHRRPENGIYYYGIKNELGKIPWKSTGCKLKSDAAAYIKTVDVNAAQVQKIAKAPDTEKDMLLSDYFKLYKQLKKNELRTSTVELYDTAFDSFIPMIGDKPICQYTLKDIEKFKTDLIEKKRSNTTTNIYCRQVKAVFHFAAERKHLKEYPFEFCKALKVPKRKKVPFLTRADLALVLEHVKNQTLKEFITTATLSGMRLSEIINLKWTAINLEQHTILVMSDEDNELKTESSERVVPIHDDVYAILQKRKAVAKSAFVFCKPNGFRYEKDFVSRVFKRAVRDTKTLDPALHFHSTRHSAASLMAAAGQSIWAISQILGHSSVLLTSNTYSHVQPSALHSVINAI